MEYAKELADSLRGVNVVITGRKVDGTPYRGRHLENISFKQRKSGWVVEGWCPVAKAVRCFEIGLITEMVLAEAPSQKIVTADESKSVAS